MLRDLDRVNLPMASAGRAALSLAFLSLVFGAIGMALASEAAPNLALSHNPLWVACCVVCIGSVPISLVPRLLGWKWQAQHFGASTLHLASVAIPGAICWLCFLMYGAPPVLNRFALFAVYAAMLVASTRRYVVLYRTAYKDAGLRACLYQTEGDRTFYLQRGDARFLDRNGAGDAFPHGGLLLGTVPFAFLLLLVFPGAVRWAGLPAPHVFFAIVFPPIDMGIAALVTRSWLVFFHLPAKIFRETGTRVYVDMATKSPPMPRRRRRANPGK